MASENTLEMASENTLEVATEIKVKAKWTDTETEAILAGVARYGVGKWRMIKNDAEWRDILKRRTSSNIRDRYRTVSKKTTTSTCDPSTIRLVTFFHAKSDYDLPVHTELIVAAHSSVKDVIDLIKSKVRLSNTEAQVRLYEVFNHKIIKILDSTERLPDEHSLRAEETLETNTDFLVSVCHFEGTTFFGDPFVFVIHDAETLEMLKTRIQKKLEVPEEEFVNWRFACMVSKCVKYMEESDNVHKIFMEKKGSNKLYLGLEHKRNEEADKRKEEAGGGIKKRSLSVVFIGMTVNDVGEAHFDTEITRFTIVDHLGLKSDLPNMLSGTSQADIHIGVLVISAEKGEFERKIETGWDTFELAKSMGLSKLVVAVDEMDDPTLKWSKERYDEIQQIMVPFLESSGYNTKKDVVFLPVSRQNGINIKKRMGQKVCPWWSGPSLYEVLDTVVPPGDPNGPFRMPIINKIEDMGAVTGRVVSGTIRDDDSLIMLPNKEHVKVAAIYCGEDQVENAGPGETLKVAITGMVDKDIRPGFVLSSIEKPVPAVTEFFAQLEILELPDNDIIKTGYKANLHIHEVVEECEIIELESQSDLKTRKRTRKKVLPVENGATVMCRIKVSNSISVEKFTDFPQLGQFTLQTEGKTIAIGKVTDLAGAASIRL